MHLIKIYQLQSACGCRNGMTMKGLRRIPPPPTLFYSTARAQVTIASMMIGIRFFFLHNPRNGMQVDDLARREQRQKNVSTVGDRVQRVMRLGARGPRWGMQYAAVTLQN